MSGQAAAVERSEESAPGVASIRLNPILEALLDELVLRVAQRTGEATEAARRGVELAVVSRGIELLQREHGE